MYTRFHVFLSLAVTMKISTENSVLKQKYTATITNLLLHLNTCRKSFSKASSNTVLLIILIFWLKNLLIILIIVSSKSFFVCQFSANTHKLFGDSIHYRTRNIFLYMQLIIMHNHYACLTNNYKDTRVARYRFHDRKIRRSRICINDSLSDVQDCLSKRGTRISGIFTLPAKAFNDGY